MRLLAERLIAANNKVKVFGYSAGCTGLSDLQRFPGASKVLAGWTILNDRAVTSHILQQGTKAVSQDAADQYSSVACANIAAVGNSSDYLAIGVTASVASDYEKRAPDEAYISIRPVWQPNVNHKFHLEFLKLPEGSQSDKRIDEESIIVYLLEWLVAHYLGFGDKEIGVSFEDYMVSQDLNLFLAEYGVSLAYPKGFFGA